MQRFAKIVNNKKHLKIYAKTLHLIYWLGSEYASELIRSMFQVFRPFKMELQPGNSLFEQKKIFKGKSLPRLAFSKTTLDCNPYATLFFFLFSWSTDFNCWRKTMSLSEFFSGTTRRIFLHKVRVSSKLKCRSWIFCKKSFCWVFVSKELKMSFFDFFLKSTRGKNLLFFA